MKIDVPDSPSSSLSSLSNSNSFHSILQYPATIGPTQVPMANREPMDQDSPEAQLPRIEVSVEQLQHLFAGVSARNLVSLQLTLSTGVSKISPNPSPNPNLRLRQC